MKSIRHSNVEISVYFNRDIHELCEVNTIYEMVSAIRWNHSCYSSMKFIIILTLCRMEGFWYQRNAHSKDFLKWIWFPGKSTQIIQQIWTCVDLFPTNIRIHVTAHPFTEIIWIPIYMKVSLCVKGKIITLILIERLSLLSSFWKNRQNRD